MQTFRRIRRTIAAVLLVLYLAGCYHWRLEYVAPTEMGSKSVRVTTIAGTRLWLSKPWVLGDSLFGRRMDLNRTTGFLVPRDTVGLSLAEVAQLQMGKYKGPVEPDSVVQSVFARTKPPEVRVATTMDTLRLTKPWVRGDSLFGYRAATGTGSADTIAVALANVRRLNVFEPDPDTTMGVGIGAFSLVISVVVLATMGQTSFCCN